MNREDARQSVHVVMTGFAVLLRWLSLEQALVLAGAAVALNWIVLPATGLDRAIRRPGAPFVDGIKLYPVAVLLALALFPMPVAAAAWAVMGVGDSASNLVGRRLGRPPFLGRSDRSLAGTLAFVAFAWPAAWALHAFVSRTGGDPLAALAAAAAGAAAEYVPLPRWLDDNLPVALVGGAAFLVAA